MPSGGIETFIQTKIYPTSTTNEADHVIRRALAMCRLCYEEVSDNVEQVTEKLKECVGPNWFAEYTSRNSEEPRMVKTNSRVKQQ